MSDNFYEALREDLTFWQKTLRLQDWDITLKVTKQSDKSGLCRKLSDYKAASLEILDPECIGAAWLGNDDPEVTLVHELLHLQGEALDDFIAGHENGRWVNDHERFIELTAIALVTLRRSAA